MKKYNVVFHNRVEEYLNELKKQHRKEVNKILQCIQIVEERGLNLSSGWCKKIKAEKDLWELRVCHIKKEYRLIFTMKKSTFIILHIFIKKGMKIPSKEIEIARKRRDEI